MYGYRLKSLAWQTQPQWIQEFGFVQSSRTYSITEFGEIADKFKSDYFNLPCKLFCSHFFFE